MASMTAMMELMTEKQPLTAQDQGTSSAFMRLAILTPTGKGVPIRNPRGANRKMETITLRPKLDPKNIPDNLESKYE